MATARSEGDAEEFAQPREHRDGLPADDDVAFTRSLDRVLLEDPVLRQALGVDEEDAHALLARPPLDLAPVRMQPDDQERLRLVEERHGRHLLVVAAYEHLWQARSRGEHVEVVSDDRADQMPGVVQRLERWWAAVGSAVKHAANMRVRDSALPVASRRSSCTRVSACGLRVKAWDCVRLLSFRSVTR